MDDGVVLADEPEDKLLKALTKRIKELEARGVAKPSKRELLGALNALGLTPYMNDKWAEKPYNLLFDFITKNSS